MYHVSQSRVILDLTMIRTKRRAVAAFLSCEYAITPITAPLPKPAGVPGVWSLRYGCRLRYAPLISISGDVILFRKQSTA